VHLIWYVDDILILGDSQQAVSTNLDILLHTCKEAGLIMNKTKYQLTPSQQVNYLGQQINLKTRMVGPQPAKLSRGLKMTRAYLQRRKSSPAHIAGVAWTLLDLQKGNVALHGLAKCIMREAAWMLHGGVAWKAYALYSEKLFWVLKDALEALIHPVTRPIGKPPPHSVTLGTDAIGENWGGGALDRRRGGEANECHHSFSHNQDYFTLP